MLNHALLTILESEMRDCIFCKIVNGELKSHIVWEDDDFSAFLSIFPNTEGVTVVVPKKHKPSYIFENADDDIKGLMIAAKKTAKKIDSVYEDVGRTGVIFEGFGVDHLHAKLYPMHGTGKMQEWKQLEKTKPGKYFEKYPGYLTSVDSKKADDAGLDKTARKIRDADV